MAVQSLCIVLQHNYPQPAAPIPPRSPGQRWEMAFVPPLRGSQVVPVARELKKTVWFSDMRD